MAEENKDEAGGFKVVDRRHFDPDGSVRPEGEASEKASPAEASPAAASPAEASPAETAAADAAPGVPSEAPPSPESEATAPPVEAQEENAGYHVGESPAGYGKLDFTQFLFGVVQLAFTFLGDLPNPQTGRRERNVAAAKQQIDLLLLLRDKTKGNLTSQEDKLLGSILYDLQLRFVEVVRGGPGPEGGEVG